ncbi:DUF2530 domain-containing protein [Agromyces sp. ISL-38]|uniref:DUF2530 domain-containing protein n=1 Tax=Agromyces sp. ISL-38 TaxID=2819107 RepID=UPI001BE99E1C|nr:DUF2530 domain-containing protein [Agromyces sp. ISL-38]MBT2518742.1 DUF2530 domain-containing protein [Streptomyces sp. ISL-90]
MRLWLGESERRPDPAPARTDARTALAVGTAVWLVALIVSVVLQAQLDAAGLGWFTAASIAGVVAGLLGLTVVFLVRRRVRRSAGD